MRKLMVIVVLALAVSCSKVDMCSHYPEPPFDNPYQVEMEVGKVTYHYYNPAHGNLRVIYRCYGSGWSEEMIIIP